MQRGSSIRAIGFLISGLVLVSPVRAETWEKQAERLQNVSAAMVDDLPFAEMPMGSINFTIKANVSLLPKTNATVGGKSESVPSSPVHTVPTLQGDLLIDPLAGWSTGVRLWAGYLPAGSEKLVHLKAAIHQSVYGVSWINRFRTRAVEPGFELGVQKGSATIKGAITASDADDEFRATTQLTYVALGFRIPAWRTWSTLLCAMRRAESEFNIPADQTSLHLVDTLDDSSPPMAAQLAVGVDLANGLQLGLGQVIVPKRVSMTRLLIGWKVAL